MTANYSHMVTCELVRYGSHPIYAEHWYYATTRKVSASGVLLLRYSTATESQFHLLIAFLSSTGLDIFLQMPLNSKVSLINCTIGSILDFYFFSGPSDAEVIVQYSSVIRHPMW
jgi:alpha-glucosidase